MCLVNMQIQFELTFPATSWATKWPFSCLDSHMDLQGSIFLQIEQLHGLFPLWILKRGWAIIKKEKLPDFSPVWIDMRPLKALCVVKFVPKLSIRKAFNTRKETVLVFLAVLYCPSDHIKEKKKMSPEIPPYKLSFDSKRNNLSWLKLSKRICVSQKDVVVPARTSTYFHSWDSPFSIKRT